MIWIWIAALVLVQATSGLSLVIALAITIYKIKNRAQDKLSGFSLINFKSI